MLALTCVDEAGGRDAPTRPLVPALVFVVGAGTSSGIEIGDTDSEDGGVGGERKSAVP